MQVCRACFIFAISRTETFLTRRPDTGDLRDGKKVQSKGLGAGLVGCLALRRSGGCRRLDAGLLFVMAEGRDGVLKVLDGDRDGM
jgi:hypothetical protein